jgi:ribokinase
MQKPKIVVVGSANMDIYTWTHHLPESGETVVGNRYWMGMGGKGANQTVGARKLEAEVVLVGRLGNDAFGRELRETLTAHDVSCDYIQVDLEAGSGMAMVLVDRDANNIIAVVPGANMQITSEDVTKAETIIQAADVLMMQLEIPLDAIEQALDIAHKGEAVCILNPAPARQLPDSILQRVHILTPNQSEARILSGIDADTPEGAAKAGQALLDKGVQTVIVTLGDQGALIVEPGKTTHVPGYKVEAMDTSGAGDAFMAGLGVALGEGQPLPEAVRFANRVGALSTTKPGATPSMPTREAVEQFAQQVDH